MSSVLPAGKPVGILFIVLGMGLLSYAGHAIFSGEVEQHQSKGSHFTRRRIIKHSEKPVDFWIESGILIVGGGLLIGKGVMVIKKANEE
jgi:hypothetical protein